MENKRIRDTPVIVAPEGYEPWEVVETDDEGYDFDFGNSSTCLKSLSD